MAPPQFNRQYKGHRRSHLADAKLAHFCVLLFNHFDFVRLIGGQTSLEEDVRVSDLAERYGLGANTIYNWRSKYYKEQGIEPSGQVVKEMTDSEREIAHLKKQLREAQLERDILKKTINIFSKGD